MHQKRRATCTVAHPFSCRRGRGLGSRGSSHGSRGSHARVRARPHVPFFFFSNTTTPMANKQCFMLHLFLPAIPAPAPSSEYVRTFLLIALLGSTTCYYREVPGNRIAWHSAPPENVASGEVMLQVCYCSYKHCKTSMELH